MKTHVLALDQGTTSSRAILFDAEGRIVATAQKEFEQHFPAPGLVEHDPDEIWATQIGCAAECLQRARVRVAEVAALGITNQRETTVVWERASGRPIHRAIVWQDRRTAPACDALRAAGHEDLIRQRAGLVADAYFSGTKVAWILDHVPGARARAERGELCFGTVDSWLVSKLTGGRVHATDVTNASRTMLFDLATLDWDDELLALLRVPRAVLPEVRPSSGSFGEVDSGLPLGGLPIAGIAGDQQAALFGQMCTEPGLAKNTYGTGCFLLANTGTAPVLSTNRLVTTVAWQLAGAPARYALEGSVFIGGAVVQWLRDGLGIIRSAAEVEALAASVPDSGGVVLVPAFAGLGAPHWDQYARGTICGITRGTTAAHLARAALESIAFQVADLVDAMQADAGQGLAELRVDGGAAANDALMQLQADFLQAPVVRPTVTETTALGAAYLAGLATGFFPSLDAIRSNWQIDRRFEPRLAADRVAALRERWCAAVERARDWARGSEA
jgi:glycerol kinase